MREKMYKLLIILVPYNYINVLMQDLFDVSTPVIFIITIATNKKQNVLAHLKRSSSYASVSMKHLSTAVPIFTSLPSSILFLWFHSLRLLHRRRKCGADLLPVLETTWSWNFEFPDWGLLVEDGLQMRIVERVIQEDVAAVVGVLLVEGLAGGGLGRPSRGVFLLFRTWRRVNFRASGGYWARVLGGSSLPLWQECPPPFGPFCHVWQQDGSWALEAWMLFKRPKSKCRSLTVLRCWSKALSPRSLVLQQPVTWITWDNNPLKTGWNIHSAHKPGVLPHHFPLH